MLFLSLIFLYQMYNAILPSFFVCLAPLLGAFLVCERQHSVWKSPTTSFALLIALTFELSYLIRLHSTFAISKFILCPQILCAPSIFYWISWCLSTPFICDTLHLLHKTCRYSLQVHVVLHKACESLQKPWWGLMKNRKMQHHMKQRRMRKQIKKEAECTLAPAGQRPKYTRIRWVG